MAEDNNFLVGDIQISPQHNTISKGDASKRLQPKVMAVLHYLAKNSDRVIDNDELLEHVWKGRVVTHSSIQKSVNALRSAFSELDAECEYIVHFSKRGYQLVVPVSVNEVKREGAEAIATKSRFVRGPLSFVVMAIFAITGSYLAYLFVPSIIQPSPSVKKLYMAKFTQVKPYALNTGRERVFEPHAGSEQVAFIRGEGVNKESRLIIRGASGREWQVSVARGQFVDLAWSPSGRNLVAVDAHSEESVSYYTFHIFTLDFKGEKVIEKNLLSHWLGGVSSVSWVDENILEFVALQGIELKDGLDSARYRYGIADQNLTKLNPLQGGGKPIASQLLNKRAAVHSALDSGEQVQFFGEDDKLVGTRALPFDVVSMSWIPDGRGVLLLSEVFKSDGNRLFVLYTDGTLLDVDYSPRVNGRILRARSMSDGRSLILTVEADVAAEQFMTKGGGFIYSVTPPHSAK